MADRNTSGAVHLTSLDLDVSNILSKLDTVDKRLQQTIEVAQKFNSLSLNSSASTSAGGTSGASSEQKQKQEEITVTIKALNELEGKYLSIQKQVESFRITTDGENKTLETLRQTISDTLSFISKFSGAKEAAVKSGERSIPITKEEKAALDSYFDSVKMLSNELSALNNSLIQNGEAFANNLSKVSGTVRGLLSIQSSMATNTKVDKSSVDFQNLSTSVKTASDSIQKLYEEISKSGKITDSQAAQINTIKKQLSDYRVEWDKLKATASATSSEIGKSIKSIPDLSKAAKSIAGLINQYSNLLIKTTEKRGRFEPSIFGNIPQEAKTAISELQNLLKEIENTGTVSTKNAQRIGELTQNFSLLDAQMKLAKVSAIETGTGLKKITDPDFSKTISGIESLNLQYKNFLNSLSKSSLTDFALGNIPADAQKAANEISKLASAVKDSGKVTDEQKRKFEELASTLKGLRGNLADTERKAIETGTGFKDLGKTAETSGGRISNFINRLADRAKWMIAYRLIMMIRTAFNNVISTIKETEDSVVKLQRVLNDESLSGTQIQSQLFDIASQYGQTFENVREAATLFAQTGQDWNEVLDSVHATMLGLNTAEISVQQATEGLIAVMSQFDLEATDLEDIINKISITADSFPVTSEKIITALQRMGATASTMGLSLEESIALITELSKTTGRSGQNIGTALNSLLQYTQKASSLELFAGLSKEMDELVGKFKAGSASILDVWQGLSKEINSLSLQQQEALFSSQEYSEFADKLESEAAEYADAIKGIYGTAGTYRQTYFIAALKDIDTVREAMDNMANSEEYAAGRNELYMETLTAHWNQLVIAAKELAVQFGNSGFLSFLKVLTDVTTGVLKVTKSIGGLTTVLLGLSSVLIMVKRQRINEYFSTVTASTNFLTRAMQAYSVSVANGATQTQALKVALGTLNLGIGGFISIGLASLTVVYSLVSAYKNWREEQKAAREELVASIDSTKSSILQFNDLKDAYDNATEGTEEFKNAQKELLEYLGYQESNIGPLKNKYGDLKTAIEELTESERDYLEVQIMKEKNAAESSFADIELENINELAKSSENAKNALNELVKAGSGEATSFGREGNIKYFIESLQKVPQSSKEAKDTIKELDKYIEILKSTLTSKELSGNEVYMWIIQYRKQLADLIKKVDDADAALLRMQGVLPKLKGGVEDAFHSLNNLDESFSNISGALNNTDEYLEDISDKFDELSGAVDNFQSAYSTIVDVIDEYNETGKMTADMLQSLLELDPQYLAIIEEKNGALSINQEKLNDLIVANDDYLIKLTAVKIAEDAAALSEQLRGIATENLTEAEIRSRLATIALSGELEKNIYLTLSGKKSNEDLARALEEVGKSAGWSKSAIDFFSDSVLNATNQSAAFIKMMNLQATNTGTKRKRGATTPTGSGIGTYYTPKTSLKSGSSSKTAAERFEEQIKSLDESFDDMIENYEHTIYLMEKENAPTEKIIEVYDKIQKAIEEQLKKYRSMGVYENSKYIRDLEKQWWELQEEIEEVYDGIYDKAVTVHENAIKLLKNQYYVIESQYDFSGMRNNLNMQSQELKKIMEMSYKEIERLIKDGKNINDDAVQDVIDTWWDAYNDFQDIASQISEDIINTYDDFIDLADAFEIWDHLDFTKVDYLEKKMADINSLYQQGIISLKEYKSLVESVGTDIFNARKEALEKQGENRTDYYNKLKEEYELEKEALSDRKEELQEYYDTQTKEYEKQIEALEKQKDKSDKYYDDLIENLKKVEKENDRVNAQLDYYAERQKILTNLEQAQSRSGIEWREKEREYQQQLVDLDSDWNRTLEGWNLTDQIENLENLKQAAAEEFESIINQLREYIDLFSEESENALKGIDDEIDIIDEKIKQAEKDLKAELEDISNEIEEWRVKIYNSITQGTADGVANAKNSMSEALSNFEGLLSEAANNKLGDTANSAAISSAKSWEQNFKNPVISQIESVGNSMKTNLVSSAGQAASSMAKEMESKFLSPTRNEINKLMNQLVKMQNTSNLLNRQVMATKVQQTSNTANIYANIANTAAANATAKSITSQFMTNPTKVKGKK